MPDCSFEELIPIFSARYSRDHLWLRPAMKRYGIWRLVHRSHPENSWPMTRSSRNHCITITYQILHLMYCRTYVNLYDAVRSVREFQYGGNFSVSWDRNFPEINFGFTSQFSRTHGTMPPINFRVELKACFCRIKWLTSNIRHNRNNFHLMWESTIATISSWASTAWAVFPRPVCGVTIWRNLIGLPLLRVVNNSDLGEWGKHGNGAKQVTWYGLVLALDCCLSAIHYSAVQTAQQFRKLCCR